MQHFFVCLVLKLFDKFSVELLTVFILDVEIYSAMMRQYTFAIKTELLIFWMVPTVQVQEHVIQK